MPETMVKGAFHFNFDPAKTVIGGFCIPETITLTVSVGKELQPFKVPSSCLPPEIQEAMDCMAEKEILKANKMAKPVAAQEETSATTEAAVKEDSQPSGPVTNKNGLSLF